MTKLLEKLLLLLFFLWPLSTVYIFDEKFLGGEKWQFGTGAIYAIEVLLWLIILIFLINQICIGQKLSIAIIKDKLKYFDYKVLITLAVWLFIAFAGLSLLWAADKSTGLYLWLHLLEVGVLFFILLITKLDIKKIAVALTISAAIQALIGFQQFLAQQVSGQKYLGLVARTPEQLGGLVIETAGGRWLRASGTFNDPNLLSGFLVISLIAGCWLYANSKYKVVILGLLTTITFGLFFTFSRGALIALVAGLFILIFSQKFNLKKWFAPTAAIILTLATLAIIFSPLVLSRANPAGRLEQRSIQERLTQNETALAMFKQHPLIGVGLNNYTYNLYLERPGLPAYKYQEAENIYLLLLAELGLIGLLLFLLLIVSISCQALKFKNYWAFSVLITSLALGIFYHYPYSQFPGLLLFWLALYFLLNVSESKIDNLAKSS